MNMNTTMTKTMVAVSLVLGSVAAFAGPACNVAKDKWMTEEAFKAKVTADGYTIKTFKVSFRQTAVSERHHPTPSHPWHRLLRLYLLKCHLQLVIDGRRHLLRLRHRLLTLSSAFEVRCLDSLI